MQIGYFCYNLSGTGPRVRAQNIINGFATQTNHEVVVLTSEPNLVESGASNAVPISIRNPISVLRKIRRYLADCDVVHVPINLYQVCFVRTRYHGPLVAGIGPGLQSERRHKFLARVAGIDARIRTHRHQFELPIDGFTARCTATINTDIFRPYSAEERMDAREELAISDVEAVLLYVGYLSREQGARLIDQMAETQLRADTTMLVVGSGPLADRMRDNNSIRFDGFVENKKLPMYYNIADFTIGPRRNDVTSNVGLESIACGTPFISTADGPIRSLFLHENNIYVWADRTPQDVWQTAQSLLNNQEAYEQQVQRGLNAIVERPVTLNNAIELIEEVYLTLVSNKSLPPEEILTPDD
jgi:glycosyltransferase involved in cell wall biosynthesis